MKKKKQNDRDVFKYRWFVVKNGVLSYYIDRKVYYTHLNECMLAMGV